MSFKQLLKEIHSALVPVVADYLHTTLLGGFGSGGSVVDHCDDHRALAWAMAFHLVEHHYGNSCDGSASLSVVSQGKSFFSGFCGYKTMHRVSTYVLHKLL